LGNDHLKNSTLKVNVQNYNEYSKSVLSPSTNHVISEVNDLS